VHGAIVRPPLPAGSRVNGCGDPGSAALAGLPNAIVGRRLGFAVTLRRRTCLGRRDFVANRRWLRCDGGDTLVLAAQATRDRFRGALRLPADIRAWISGLVVALARREPRLVRAAVG
jgi:hypothetical protein